MRVLIVEDDSVLARSLETMIRSAHWVGDVTTLGEDAVEIAKLYDYDIILLDVLLPDVDGYEVARRLRAARITTPILMLSGLDSPDDKVKGLGIGADDYLAKPFDRRELLARIQAIVRRAKGHSAQIITVGRLTINLETRSAAIGGQPLHLTGKEYAILELLALRKGTPLTKAMFLNHLYGGIDEPDVKIIDVFVCKLRKKLAAVSAGETFVETVWGRGYVMRDTAEETASLTA